MKPDWYAIVVDVNDPEKSGRAKIRILGLQDDKTKIPDADLFWARPKYPITNAALKGVATQSTGLMKGTLVSGYWADDDQQIPIMDGVHGSAGTLKADGTLDQSAPTSTPLVVREIDKNEIFGTSIIDKAVADAKSLQLTTIAAIKFTPGDKLDDLLKQLDPSNKSGAIPNLLSGLNSIKSSSSILSSLRGALGSLVPTDLLKMVSAVQHAVTSVEGIAKTAAADAAKLGINITVPTINIPTLTNASLPQIDPAASIQDTATSILKNTLGGAVGPLIGPLKQISSVQDVIKAAGSFNFMQNKTMPALETGWSIIKQSAKKINV